jgi:very-short-patch-repair endonuclease
MKADYVDKIKNALRLARIDFITEYKFLDKRKFRFDIAIPEYMIGIEYEGIVSTKSRHTSITGYSKDCDKYNLAVLNGWKVLRFTALHLSKNKEHLIPEMVRDLMNQSDLKEF